MFKFIKKIPWNIVHRLYMYDFIRGKFAWFVASKILWPGTWDENGFEIEEEAVDGI